MKKLLFILILLASIGIQTARGQCPQPYEMSRLPDFRVFIPNAIDTNTTWTSYNGSAEVQKQVVTANGDLWISGNFSKVVQFDPTGTPTQILNGLKGLAKRDAITGVWSAIPLPLGGTLYASGKLWYVDGYVHATIFHGQNLTQIEKFDPGTSTWLNIPSIPNPGYVMNIIATGDPYNYRIAYHAMPPDYTGLRLWNSQSGNVSVTIGSDLPDWSSLYTINETQTSDTIFAKLDDIANMHRVLIKGQNTVLDFSDIGITQNPLNGFGQTGFISMNDAIIINGEIYAAAVHQMYNVMGLMHWNKQTAQWDSVAIRNGFVDEIDLFFYDKLENKLYVKWMGIVDLNTGEFTSVPWVQPYTFSHLPDMRQGNNLYSTGGLLKDTTCVSPNTTAQGNATQVYGEQNITFTATNGHDGDIANFDEKINGIVTPIGSLNIDATNCSNFSFTRYVTLGTHEYHFTLIDPNGNVSQPTILTVTASWPTGINDPDKDFAFVHTEGKQISIKGEVSKIQIYDLNSKVIFSSDVNSNQFTQSLDNIASGIYILKAINSKGEMMTKKLLLN